MYYIIIGMGVVACIAGIVIILAEVNSQSAKAISSGYFMAVKKVINRGNVVVENKVGVLYKYNTVDDLHIDMENINKLNPAVVKGLHLEADLNRLELGIYK